MLKNELISFKGIAIVLLIAIAPFNRYLLNGRGMIYWALLLCIILYALSFIKIKASSFKIYMDEANRVRTGLICLNVILIASVLFSPFLNPLTLNSSKVQICAILLFSYILNPKEEKIASFASFIGALILLYLYFYSSSTRGGIRTYIELQDGMYLDPNMVSAAFIIPCAYAVHILTTKRRVLLKCGMIVFLALWLYTSFMGGSRSGLLAGIIGIVAFVLAKYKVSAKTMLYAMGGVVFAIIVYNAIKDSLSLDILERMTIGNVIATDGSGRTNIWSSHIDLFLSSNPFRVLFGYGRESCANVAGISAHNTIIDYMWDLGVIGLLLYVVATVMIVKYCLKSNSSIAISVVISTVLWSVTISASNQLIYWVLLYFAFTVAHNHCQLKAVEEVNRNESSLRNSGSLNRRNRTYGSNLG